MDIDLGGLERLHAVLKAKTATTKTKKSAVFTREQIDEFFIKATGEEYRVPKLSLLLALRRSEICNLKQQDFTRGEDHLVVTIPTSKSDRAGNGRKFVVVSDEDPRKCAIKLYDGYIQKIKAKGPNERFWKQYRHGKYTSQNRGKNYFSNLPTQIAKFLNLPNANEFTGHALRRTAATLLANTGIDKLSLKRFGGWKSDSVCEGYIAESMDHKRKLAEAITAQPPKKNKN
jgi:integrase